MQVTMGTEHAQTVCTRLFFLCARTYKSLGTRLRNILFLINCYTDLLITPTSQNTVCIYPFTLITVIEAFGKHSRNLAVSFIRDTHCADYFAPWTSNSYYILYIPNPCVLGTRPVLPCKNCYCRKLELVRAKTMLGLQSLQFICHWLLTVASVSLGLPMQLELSCL